MSKSFFTADDVRKINQDLIDKKSLDISKLSPFSQKIIRQFQLSPLSTSEINSAYSVARKTIEG